MSGSEQQRFYQFRDWWIGVGPLRGHGCIDSMIGGRMETDIIRSSDRKRGERERKSPQVPSVLLASIDLLGFPASDLVHHVLGKRSSTPPTFPWFLFSSTVRFREIWFFQTIGSPRNLKRPRCSLKSIDRSNFDWNGPENSVSSGKVWEMWITFGDWSLLGIDWMVWESKVLYLDLVVYATCLVLYLYGSRFFGWLRVLENMIFSSLSFAFLVDLEPPMNSSCLNCLSRS